MTKKIKKLGFTLVELLVVIAIIGLLAVVVAANVKNARTKAKIAKTNQTVEQYYKALSLYYAANKQYPYIGDAIWYCLGDYEKTIGKGTFDDLTGSHCFDPQAAIYPNILVSSVLENALDDFIADLPKDSVDCGTGGIKYNYIYQCQPNTVPVDPLCQKFAIVWWLETQDQSKCNVLGIGSYKTDSNAGSCIKCRIDSQ